MNLWWIPHQKKEGARHTIQHYYCIMTCPPRHNHRQAMLPFRFNYSHVLPINLRYVQKIVRATSPQSMNVGVWLENYGQFLLCKVSNIRSYSCATMNQHLCCGKEGKRAGTQRKTKVSPYCTHCSDCGWRKGTFWPKATSMGKKNEPIALAIVKLCCSEGIRQSVS